MASNSSGDNQPTWNAQLFASAARNALTKFAKDSAKNTQSNSEVTEAKSTSTSSGTTNGTVAGSTSSKPNSQPAAPVQTNDTPTKTETKTSSNDSASSHVDSKPSSNETSKSDSSAANQSNPAKPEPASQNKKLDPSSASSRSQTKASLKPPLDTKTDLKTMVQAAFLALNANYTGVISECYKKISGDQPWKILSEDIKASTKTIENEYAKHCVFLLCSGSLGQSIVPNVHPLPQVHTIYIHCVDVDLHLTWAKHYAKVRIVSNQLEKFEIIPQMAYDYACLNYDWACVLIEQGDKMKAKEKLSKAMELLEKSTENRHDPKYLMMIQEKMNKCA